MALCSVLVLAFLHRKRNKMDNYRCNSVSYDSMGSRFITNFVQIDDTGKDHLQGVSFTIYSPTAIWTAGIVYNHVWKEVKK